MKKLCSMCKKKLLLSQFGKWVRGLDGLKPQCRKCLSAWNRQWAQTNAGKVRLKNQRLRAQHPERYREYQRAYRRRHPEVVQKSNALYRETHSLERAAHHAVETALQKGWLKQSTRCERCRKTVRVQAHHHDYTAPLVIEWLCARCHKLEHL